MNDEQAPMTEQEPNVQARSSSLNGGLDPSEMGRGSGQARREKAAQRAQQAEENALTFRQRLGVGLSKLTQADPGQRGKGSSAISSGS
jgi:hypothetical protein